MACERWLRAPARAVPTVTLIVCLFGGVPQLAAGQSPETAAAISAAMDNPISELFMLQTQFDSYRVSFPLLGEEKTVNALKIIPTFPIPLSSKVNFVNRIMLGWNSLPINERFGDLTGVSASPYGQGFVTDDPREVEGAVEEILADPFDRTTGFGDVVYIGLFGPRHPPKIGDNTLIWAAGYTSMFPTASTDILGLDKYSAGPAAVVAYLTDNMRLGVFPQHWWSYAGNDDRASVSMTNIQYFAFWAPNPLTAIGAMPNIVINWEADEKLTLPLGIGANRTFFLGKLPVRGGVEFHYNVIHPDDSAHSKWNLRVFLIPVIPAPWGDLAKALRGEGS